VHGTKAKRVRQVEMGKLEVGKDCNTYEFLAAGGFFPLLHNQQKSASYEQKLNRQNKV